MKTTIKHLWLVTALILAASAVLLVSDLEQRHGQTKKKQPYPLIAVMQIASTTLLDTHVEGVTTPVLIAAKKRNFDFPLVFTVASDSEKLGLFEKGRPENICGIHDDPPVDQVLEMARKSDPALNAVGIIYDPSQTNSLISVEKLRKAGKQQNVKMLEATIMAPLWIIARAASGISETDANT